MNRYENSMPRGAFAVAALALSTLTMGVLVDAPASLHPSTSVLSTAQENIATSRIEVIASRRETLAFAAADMPHVDR
jgi:hypothetical protein